jgi:multidrug efflux pump subunit AcrA (membrane-fusion protein)
LAQLVLRLLGGVICIFLLMDVAVVAAEAPTTTQTSADTTAVKKGTISATIDADGYFEAVDPFEVRIRPDSYQGDLKIKSAVALGAAVKQGDVVLEIDPTTINKQIAEAENALIAAKATLAKAESDDYLGEQGDALALQMEQTDVANSEASLKWWQDVDGKQMLKQAELGVRAARNNVEDQGDELDQLKKMYKTEELTNATADIVVKRAVRALELAKIQQGLSEAREGKVKEFDYTTTRQKLLFAIEAEKQKLAQLKAQQDAQRVLRKTALTTARLSADKAETKVNELKGDRDALTIHAPVDGMVFYGQLSQGTWTNSNPKLLRTAERVTAGQVLMTVAQPGKLRFVCDIPESKVNWIQAGAEARIIPVAVPEGACMAKCVDVAPNGGAREGSQAFQAQFELPPADAKIFPGMKASARIDAGEAKDVLVLPIGCVSKGRVKVHADGKDTWRDIVVGKSDGEMVEIRQGLKEGEQVMNKAGK